MKAGVKANRDYAVLAFGDKLYLVANDNGYQVREYDLAKLGEPRVVLTNTDDSQDHRRGRRGAARTASACSSPPPPTPRASTS